MTFKAFHKFICDIGYHDNADVRLYVEIVWKVVFKKKFNFRKELN